MSLTAVPVYLLARRLRGAAAVARRRSARGCASVARLHGHGDDGERLLPALRDGGARCSFSSSSARRRRGKSALLALVGLLFATRVQAVAFVPAIVAAPFLLALLGKQPLRSTLKRFRFSTPCWPAARCSCSSRRSCAGARSRISSAPTRSSASARTTRRPCPVLPLPPGRARPLSRRDPVRGVRAAHRSARGARTPVLAPFLAAGIALTVSVLARRRRVRVGVREPDPGAEHLRRRAVLPDRAARLGRSRPAATALDGR